MSCDHRQIGAIGALVACALVFALAAGCGGSSGGDTNVAETVAQTTTNKRTTGPTVAVLQPLDGSEASGRAVYVEKPDGTPWIKLRAEGLEGAPGGPQYVIWQKHSRDDMVLLATWPAGEDGLISKAWQPSFASLGYLEGGLRTKLLITKINDIDRIFGASENSYVHNVIGSPVLEGQFEGALVGAAEGE